MSYQDKLNSSWLDNLLFKPTVMGIVNITPDSFSDGGLYFDKKKALSHILKLIEQGADILDIGGESTRPNAKPVSLAQELDRVIPIIEKVRKITDIPISIDTSKSAVMYEAVSSGANMINDVFALKKDKSLETATKLDVPVCLMHMQNNPQNMQNNPKYDNTVDDIMSFFKKRINICIKAGIKRKNIVIDPGFGFGKTFEHNKTLFKNLDKFSFFDLPILVGVSRKSTLQKLLINNDKNNLLLANISTAILAFIKGVKIIRVHDVAATKQALNIFNNLYE